MLCMFNEFNSRQYRVCDLGNCRSGALVGTSRPPWWFQGKLACEARTNQASFAILSLSSFLCPFVGNYWHPKAHQAREIGTMVLIRSNLISNRVSVCPISAKLRISQCREIHEWAAFSLSEYWYRSSLLASHTTLNLHGQWMDYYQHESPILQCVEIEPVCRKLSEIILQLEAPILIVLQRCQGGLLIYRRRSKVHRQHRNSPRIVEETSRVW